MAVFKCKMCGGSLEVAEGLSVAICEYCGTTQTLPRLNSDRVANLYDRANHFRRNNDYDKAMGIYEQILNEDSSDSEAYWSLVLCRYGIEYVEDPATKKRIPTVNRAQFTSIFSDEDYKSALQYADDDQKAIYEEEAKAIDNIQKGILEISNNEEPFDVFICYKETDMSGHRTPDSVLANDLYHQLTAEGFKVFFAAITLEDKLGSAYEPYIFAALNSAKVMVVLGTKPEFFNAVWVKNEWSRYLSLIKNGAKKALIPAYKDMDPYDLPEEFSHLQAQDMSKLGFMQDLIRGIKKIVSVDDTKESIKESIVNNNVGVEAIIDRAILLIEDGENGKADELLEQALNIAPKHPMIYVGKLMLETGVKLQEDLAKLAVPFDNSSNYQRAVRFANPRLKATLEGYIESIRAKNIKSKYDAAVEKMNSGRTEYDFLDAKRQFEEILDYQDAAELAKLCDEKVVEAKYRYAISKMNSAKTEKEFYIAKDLFLNLSDYASADELATSCDEKAKLAKNDAIYDEAYNLLTAENGAIADVKCAKEKFLLIRDHRDAEQRIDECDKKITELTQIAQKQAKKKRNITIFSVVGTIVAIAFIVVYATVIAPMQKYNKAIEMLDNELYDSAYELFTDLGDYKDSYEIMHKSIYDRATAKFEAKEYEDAYDLFVKGGSYSDCEERANECLYIQAAANRDNQQWMSAYDLFMKAGTYSDSKEQAKECLYCQAVAYRNDKNWDEANRLFEQLKDYKDSASLIHYHSYQLASSKEATCVDEGHNTYNCSCGDSYTDKFPAFGHSYSSATCTSAKKCSLCGKTDGSALGHTSGGTRCSRCGVSIFKTITYTGNSKKLIRGINLPNGQFVIKLTYTNTMSNSSWASANLFNSNGAQETSVGIIHHGEIDEQVFSGPISNGYIQLNGVYEGSWKITIEAY